MTAPRAPIAGYRVWRDAGDHLLPLNLLGDPWTRGVITAGCHHASTGSRHPAPDAACSCGLYAWHAPPVDPGPGWVLGAVLAWGRIEVHYDGIRAEHAQVVALAERDERVAALARRLGARVVPAGGLAACAQELGTRPDPTEIRCSAEQLLSAVVRTTHAVLCLMPATADDVALLTLTVAALDAAPAGGENADMRLRHALRAAAAVVRGPASGRTVDTVAATAAALDAGGSPPGWSESFDLDVIASAAPPACGGGPLRSPREAAVALAQVAADVCEQVTALPAAGVPIEMLRWLARRRTGLPPGLRPRKDKRGEWKPVERQEVPDDAPPSQRLYAARGLLPDKQAALQMANDACRDAHAWPPLERARTWSELASFGTGVDLDLVRAAVRDPAISTNDRLALLTDPRRRVDADLAKEIWDAPIDPRTAWISLRGWRHSSLRLAMTALDIDADAGSSDLARAAGALVWLGPSSWCGSHAAKRFAADPAYPLLLRGIAVGTHPDTIHKVPADDPDRPRLAACPGTGFMGSHLTAAPARIETMLWGPSQ